MDSVHDDGCQRLAWDNTSAWLELGSSLSALKKIDDRHKALTRCVSDLMQQRDTLRVEVADLQRVKAGLQSEVKYWEGRVPPNFTPRHVGVSGSDPLNASWVDGTKTDNRYHHILTAPAYTYALFDDQKLIYIGVTGNWRNRQSAHARKGYSSYVLTGWASKEVAQSAETYAIHDRHPPMNRCRRCKSGGHSVGPYR